MKNPRFHLTYFLIAAMAIWIIHGVWEQANAVAQIPYSELQTLITEKKVTDLVIEKDRIEGKFVEPREGKARFVTTRVEPELAAQLDKAGVKYAGRIDNSILPAILSWVLPAVIFFGIWAFLQRRMAQSGPGGLLSIGNSKAKVYVEHDTKTTFRDVAGVDEAKAELEEIVAFLKDPKSVGRLGAQMPKGVLLVGPPGTGKTLLARAIAGEAGVPFFSMSGSEFVELFVGVGAARVRDLFEQARQKAPCIIFIDELDSLGRARGSGFLGGHDEKEQTLNQLLAEMDGFDPTSGIILLGATNRPEVLDPALLRAGRFDRQVLVDKPDRKGRTEILKVHIAKVQLAAEVELEKIAALTPGFTGADLKNLVNEAALAATRRKGSDITMADFTSAVERIVAGLEKRSRILDPRERKIVAVHECGHALVSAAVSGDGKVHKVSIIPRGVGALGYTIQRPTEDRYLMTKEELESKIQVLLGGRAAEKVVFNHLSTGAADDLVKATEIARSMVMRFAMVPSLGPLAFDTEPNTFLNGAAIRSERRHSEETAREIDLAVRKIVEDAFDKTIQVLTQSRAALDEMAAALLEKETLDESELAVYLNRVAPRSSTLASEIQPQPNSL
ncbi:MAG: ATP-dependent zinc metalloprotease FtsH [Polyangiaceae bacterium]|nr:ATP-dependent zinc metalloprotease FtsH [Polyangiaceae bacterium]